jgi:hypothetical protein
MPVEFSYFLNFAVAIHAPLTSYNNQPQRKDMDVED